MKKLFSLTAIAAIILINSISVLAGDIPESLLYTDDAQLFIGTVESYTAESVPSAPYTKISSIEIIPTEKIKGDVVIALPRTYTRCSGPTEYRTDTEYLFGYLDENNLYAYEIESKDDKHIKLADSEKYDMTKRLEDYLNDGSFERAERERLEKAEPPADLTGPETTVFLSKRNICTAASAAAALLIATAAYLIRKRRCGKC